MAGRIGNSKIHIVLANDARVPGAGLNAMLSGTGEYTVVAEAGNGKEVVAAVMKFKPDLLLLDISIPLMNGTETIQQVKRRSRNTKVLIMTMQGSDEYLRMAMSAGADGYVLKNDGWEELVFAMRHVLKGNTYLSPAISNKVVKGFLDSRGAKNSILLKLTTRERQILKLISEGMKNCDIAEFLYISNKTVEKHRSNLMHKLDAHNVAELTALAIRCGVVGK